MGAISTHTQMPIDMVCVWRLLNLRTVQLQLPMMLLVVVVVVLPRPSVTIGVNIMMHWALHWPLCHCSSVISSLDAHSPDKIESDVTQLPAHPTAVFARVQLEGGAAQTGAMIA